MKTVSINIMAKSFKRKGALLTFEAIGYMGLLIILVGLGVGGLGLFETYRIVSCRWELREISTACITYKTLNTSNKLPTALGDLVKEEAISATDSIDGIKHGRFLKSSQRWTETNLNNPWNQPYVIDASAGKITCETDSIVGAMETEIGEVDN